jgi:hypothetical protein
MTPEAQTALDFLFTLTPTNIHLKTDVSQGQRIDFESLWNRHGPRAARYSLLARYMNGTINSK